MPTRKTAKASRSRVAKTAVRKKTSNTQDLAAAFAGLRAILAVHQSVFHVVTDEPRKYYLEMNSPLYKGKSLMFGVAIVGKAYVSFHLFPIYMQPSLLKGISPQLKKHMQGKSCFKFTVSESALFTELAGFTAAGRDFLLDKDCLSKMRKSCD